MPEWCQLNAIPMQNAEERTAAIRILFGSVGENATVLPVFNCDNGSNIHVGENFRELSCDHFRHCTGSDRRL